MKGASCVSAEHRLLQTDSSSPFQHHSASANLAPSLPPSTPPHLGSLGKLVGNCRHCSVQLGCRHAQQRRVSRHHGCHVSRGEARAQRNQLGCNLQGAGHWRTIGDRSAGGRAQHVPPRTPAQRPSLHCICTQPHLPLPSYSSSCAAMRSSSISQQVRQAHDKPSTALSFLRRVRTSSSCAAMRTSSAGFTAVALPYSHTVPFPPTSSSCAAMRTSSAGFMRRSVVPMPGNSCRSRSTCTMSWHTAVAVSLFAGSSCAAVHRQQQL